MTDAVLISSTPPVTGRPEYVDPRLFIDGVWIDTGSRRVGPVIDPSSGLQIGSFPHATHEDLDAALAAASRAFPSWAATSPRERGRILKRAADLIRARIDDIAPLATMEMGKPLAQARGETLNAAEEIEWFAEEGRRAGGRVIPGSTNGAQYLVSRHPVGPSVGFSAWNFPIGNAARKLATALAAGCTMIYKPGEESPAAAAAVIQALVDAGVPDGVVALVYGDPDDISRHLLASPVIRKMSFTGSVAVGQHLLRLASDNVIRTTMELGGHAPVLVFGDADLDRVVTEMVAKKFANSGQVCVSPTRFYVQDAVFDKVVSRFAERAAELRVGDGFDAGVSVGPLVHERRRQAIDALVQNAIEGGARLVTGGRALDRDGYFYAPTVLADVPETTRIMNEEPFGPVAIFNRFTDARDGIAKANRLPFGLAGYAFTTSQATVARVAAEVDVGMLGINSGSIAIPETPFGGVKHSGHGSELGSEGLDAFLVSKTVSIS